MPVEARILHPPCTPVPATARTLYSQWRRRFAGNRVGIAAFDQQRPALPYFRIFRHS